MTAWSLADERLKLQTLQVKATVARNEGNRDFVRLIENVIQTIERRIRIIEELEGLPDNPRHSKIA